jgi:hypothetical protein
MGLFGGVWGKYHKKIMVKISGKYLEYGKTMGTYGKLWK